MWKLPEFVDAPNAPTNSLDHAESAWPTSFHTPFCFPIKNEEWYKSLDAVSTKKKKPAKAEVAQPAAKRKRA